MMLPLFSYLRNLSWTCAFGKSELDGEETSSFHFRLRRGKKKRDALFQTTI